MKTGYSIVRGQVKLRMAECLYRVMREILAQRASRRRGLEKEGAEGWLVWAFLAARLCSPAVILLPRG